MCRDQCGDLSRFPPASFEKRDGPALQVLDVLAHTASRLLTNHHPHAPPLSPVEAVRGRPPVPSHGSHFVPPFLVTRRGGVR